MMDFYYFNTEDFSPKVKSGLIQDMTETDCIINDEVIPISHLYADKNSAVEGLCEYIESDWRLL